MTLKKVFNPQQRAALHSASHDIGIPSELARFARELLQEEAPPPLKDLPGGPSIKEFMDELADGLAIQLSLFSDTLGVSRYHSRAFVFEPETKDGERHWTTHSIRYADPNSFTPEPADLLGSIERWQTDVAPRRESIAVWSHGVDAQEPMFLLVVRHSEGTVVQFLVREKQWVRAPMSERSLNVLLAAELHKGRKTTDFWASAITDLLVRLVHHRPEAFKDAVHKAADATELTDELAAEVVKSLVSNEGGFRAIQALCRLHAHDVMAESQSLLELLVDVLDGATRAIKKESDKVRKEQAGAIKRLQSSLEKQRVLYEGIKQRAEQLRLENGKLRKRGGAAPSPRAPEAATATLTQRLNQLVSDC